MDKGRTPPGHSRVLEAERGLKKKTEAHVRVTSTFAPLPAVPRQFALEELAAPQVAQYKNYHAYLSAFNLYCNYKQQLQDALAERAKALPKKTPRPKKQIRAGATVAIKVKDVETGIPQETMLTTLAKPATHKYVLDNAPAGAYAVNVQVPSHLQEQRARARKSRNLAKRSLKVTKKKLADMQLAKNLLTTAVQLKKSQSSLVRADITYAQVAARKPSSVGPAGTGNPPPPEDITRSSLAAVGLTRKGALRKRERGPGGFARR